MTLQLEDLSLVARLGILIATILATIVMLLIVLAFEAEGQPQGRPSVPDIPSKYDEHLAALDREALEKAYHAHLVFLFGLWVKDDVQITHRVTNGLRNARRAYINASDQLEKREEQVKKRGVK